MPHTTRVQGDKTVITHWSVNDSYCGTRVYVHVSKYYYLPWLYLNMSSDSITTHFGISRARIKWDVDFSKDAGSRYSRFWDKITFAWSFAHENRSLWVAGHEYGHALHHKALGGGWGAPNCSPHYLGRPSSYKCAMKEGWADYTGIVGAPDWYLKDVLENPHKHYLDTFPPHRGRNKPVIEGYVAALFLDLIDDKSEDGDYTEYPPYYVAQVFKTCEVKKKWGLIYRWYDRRNVSDFVWCLENRINPVVHKKVFLGLDWPRGVREKATEPSDWNHIHIRWTWEKNLK